jgi:hypothetical protein
MILKLWPSVGDLGNKGYYNGEGKRAEGEW